MSIPASVESRVLMLSEQLRACKIPHAFGGAIAYVCYGLPRSTNDYDLNIFLPESRAAEVLECLEKLGIVWSSDSIARIEKTGQTRLDWDDQKVDLFFAYAPFHESVAQRVREERVAGSTITVISAEDIIVFKVIFNRPLDWRDLERLFQQGATSVDLDSMAGSARCSARMTAALPACIERSPTHGSCSATRRPGTNDSSLSLRDTLETRLRYLRSVANCVFREEGPR